MASMCRADSQCSMLLDEQFDIVWHTSSTTSVLGHQSMVGHNALEYVHPDDLEMVAELVAKFADGTLRDRSGPAFRPDPTDVRLLTADGDWLQTEVVLYDHMGDPEVNGFLVVCRIVMDRSDLARAVELIGTGAEVAEVLSLIARLVDKTLGGNARTTIAWWQDDEVEWTWSPDPPAPAPEMMDAAVHAVRSGVRHAMTITDFDDPILGKAGPVAAALGYTSANLIPIESPTGDEIMGCLLAWGHHEVEMTLYPQRPVHIGLRLAALAIADGRTKYNLRWAASHDPLTLLINRAEFARRMETMGENVALLYIDLDDFKPINDVHGHSVGDAVLVEVAARIRQTAGPLAVAGRLGGDEFAVALPGLNHVSAGLAVADQIVEAVRRPIRVGHLMLGVGASIGVALGVQPLIPSVLIQRADEALLDAKNAGKNTVKAAA